LVTPHPQNLTGAENRVLLISAAKVIANILKENQNMIELSFSPYELREWLRILIGL
jgi:hypothetical protein